MKLRVIKYNILKLSENVFTYRVTLKDEIEGSIIYFISSERFSDCKALNAEIKVLQFNGTEYEINYGKITQVKLLGFDEFFHALANFCRRCENEIATVENWQEIRRKLLQCFEAKELTKEEMNTINDKITFYFKNQGRAFSLSELIDKIKTKKVG